MGQGSRRGPLPENRSSPPERVLAAAKLLSEMRPNAVIQALMEQFQMGRSSAKRAITMARMLMEEQEKEVLPQIRAVTVARLDRLIDRAQDSGDFRSAIRGIHELARIYGLHQPEEMNVTVGPKPEAYADLTDEQVAALAALDDRPTEH